MAVSQLVEYLDSHGVKYITITHSQAFTAPEIAAAAHIKGKELAKTVMVRINGALAMAVLPASKRIDFDRLENAIGHGKISLATEHDFRGLFLDCKVGAMPPFGNLYGIDVFVAAVLAEYEEIAFNACCHTKLIRMAYRDFERLVQPKVIAFSKD
jgi:Ala-tRNA(Pro) deacylase